jgi:KDEL-tailed cysteine endopeptidase
MKLNLFFSVVSILFTLSSSNLFDVFEQWAAKHNINIDDNLIYDKIYKNWIENDKFINNVNSMNLTYKLGHNAYSGYSSEEFSELMGFNNNRERTFLRGFNEINTPLNLDQLPSSIDWRTKGVVNGVKDQGQCGSCWSFSTISSVESAVAIKTGVLNVLSEQELVDCDNLKNGGSDHGCNGGLMDNAFTWIGKQNGVCSSAAYPYVSGTTKTAGNCQMSSCKPVANTDVLKYVDIQKNSDSAMMTALSMQPVSVAIEADQKAFQLYSSGVFTSSCGTTLDHGVALVGYGSLNGIDHYILRNSWGTSWGVGGYMYLGRGNDPATGKPYNNGAGQCGVLGEASYPVMA